jgi:hypothetical protein
MVVVLQSDPQRAGSKENLRFIVIPFEAAPSFATPVNVKLPQGLIFLHETSVKLKIINNNPKMVLVLYFMIYYN